MTAYEGLSLLVSLVGTVFSIYLGLRQLRQAPPAAPPPPGAAPSPAPPSAPSAERAGAEPPTRQLPAAVRRPRSVVAASLFLSSAAALQVVVLISSWTYSLLNNSFLDQFGANAAVDLLGFGAIGVFCGLLALFVARGSRVATWVNWLLGALGVLWFPFLAFAIVGYALDPTVVTNLGGVIFTVSYLSLLAVAFIVSACLLFNAAARAFRRKNQSRLTPATT